MVLIIPKTLLALLHAATHCCELFISLDMLQQMFEVTAKIPSWLLKVKTMFARKRRLLPGNAAHVYTVAAHAR